MGHPGIVAGIEKATATTTAKALAVIRLWVGFDCFYGDGVGGVSGGEHGEEGGSEFALGADDGYVAGVGVGGEGYVLVCGEGQCVVSGAGVDTFDDLSV